jgi:phosphatidylserine/phosphatidylglycerophosphate/cardiolipin synthase-like enzyme
MRANRLASLLLAVCTVGTAVSCSTAGDDGATNPWGGDGKGDGWASERTIDTVFNEPYCDVCSADDKAFLVSRSPMVARIVQLIDGAQESVDIANYTFSVKTIEDAILRAKDRGVTIRVAMDKGQESAETVASHLSAAGVDVRFVAGSGPAIMPGLQHAKFMIVDKVTLLTGSNNWSSTGTSINEESAIVIKSVEADPLIAGFTCHYTAIWNNKPGDAGACSNDEVAFAPSSKPIAMIKREIGRAQKTIDVLMHHFVFDDLVTELAKAAERGVRVRVIVNVADRAEVSGAKWDRLLAAGGQLRFKQDNDGIYQLMHHKLAVIDDRVVVNGSGNWSGSAFFKNFENYVRYRDPRISRPYKALYDRLWQWSLSAASLDAGKTAAQQHTDETKIFFGNLHAHFAANAEGAALDDGKPMRTDASGAMVPVDEGMTPSDAARYAWEYARDEGGMDFLALSPHTCDDAPVDAGDAANMIPEQYKDLIDVAHDVTRSSSGTFVAIPAMEWSTNSAGNHVNIFGSSELSKLERGRFDRLYNDFLPGREEDGDMPLVQFNHPRTFRQQTVSLDGNWDQIFDVNLRDISSAADRSKKFNDYGLDDFPPMSTELPSWIAGEKLPDRAVVAQTLSNVELASRPYVRLFEVLVGKGTSITGENHENSSLSVNSETGEVERYTRVHSDWDYYLLNGFMTAPTAPHDNHYANWGTGHSTRTGIVATQLSEGALLDAIDQREVYASEDEELQLRMYADHRVPMGSSFITHAESTTLDVFLDDADYTGSFDVVVYGGEVGGDAVSEVTRTTITGGTWQQITVPVTAMGKQFFYLEVKEPSPDRMAWSAPIWVDRI